MVLDSTVPSRDINIVRVGTYIVVQASFDNTNNGRRIAFALFTSFKVFQEFTAKFCGRSRNLWTRICIFRTKTSSRAIKRSKTAAWSVKFLRYATSISGKVGNGVEQSNRPGSREKHRSTVRTRRFGRVWKSCWARSYVTIAS